MSPNGTLCLGTSWTRAQVLKECRAWQARGGMGSEVPASVENWLESITVGNEGRRLNVTEPCADVMQAIDQHCSFNVSEVQEFTKRVQENGGDMTISFWVKPLNEQSLSEESLLPTSCSAWAPKVPPTIAAVLESH